MHLTECLPWLWCTDRGGYGVVGIGGKSRKAHRVSYCMFHGISLEEIEGVVIRHKCDNPWCVNPEHLEPGTHQDNEDDKTSRGRRPRGELVGTSKLTLREVEEIRRSYVRYSKDFGSVALGSKYKVDSSTIRLIVSGAIW